MQLVVSESPSACPQVTNLSALRQCVDTQLSQFAAWIEAFLLVLTCLLIANSMIVSVVARTAKIGLRRALGPHGQVHERPTAWSRRRDSRSSVLYTCIGNSPIDLYTLLDEQ